MGYTIVEGFNWPFMTVAELNKELARLEKIDDGSDEGIAIAISSIKDVIKSKT